MAGVDLVIAPGGIAFRHSGERPERIGRRDAGGVDIAAWQGQRAALQLEPGLETLDRHVDPARAKPFDIGGRCIRRRRIRRHAPAVAGLRQLLHARTRHLVQVEQRLSVLRHEGVDINQLRDPVARAVGHAGGKHAAIAVADQHDVAQILILDDVQHVLDMRIEIDGRMGQMRALAEARVARGDQPMPGRLHQRVHLLPGPARGPRAVTDEKGFRRSCAHRAVSTRLLLKASIAIVPVRRVV